MKCVKILFFSFNFIFWLCGLVLIIMGVVADRTVTKIPAIQELANTTSPIVIIVVGAVIFLITSIGCCGVWKDNYCMVTTFVVLLLIIIIIETVILAISVYVWKGKLEDLPEKMMQDYTSNPDIQKGLDDIQEELKCCGAVNASDWVFFKSDKISVPDSCCKNVSPNCGAGALKNANKIYIVGCRAALESLLQENLWAPLLIGFIELILLIVSIPLIIPRFVSRD